MVTNTYLFGNANVPTGLPVSLEKSNHLTVLKKHPDKQSGEITYYENTNKKAVYVEFVKSHETTEVVGIGFFLMKMAICSSPSCRTTLNSEGFGFRDGRSPVLFYCKLGFVPKFTCLATDENIRNYASLLEKELIAAKREKRAPIWNIKLPMSLPECARRKWQVLTISDSILQETFSRDQRIIRIIHEYFLNFSSSDFIPVLETTPTDPHVYIFQTNSGKEVKVHHFFCPPNLKNIWSHKICAASEEVGIIEVQNTQDVPTKIKKLINFTHFPDRVDYIPGIRFFLLKKTLESLADSDMSLEKQFVGTVDSFFYWSLGFRFSKDEEEMDELIQLEMEFISAQQENRKPQNCPTLFGDLILPKESRAAWNFIIKIDPILQEIFKKRQKITQLVQKYLL